MERQRVAAARHSTRSTLLRTPRVRRGPPSQDCCGPQWYMVATRGRTRLVGGDYLSALYLVLLADNGESPKEVLDRSKVTIELRIIRRCI